MVSGLWRDGHGPDHLCLSNAADQMGATEDRALGARAFRRLFCRRVNCLPRLAPAVCRGGRPRGDRGAAARSPTRFGANSLSQFAFRNQRSWRGLGGRASRFRRDLDYQAEPQEIAR
jgi:hypothetical protein